MMNEHNSGGKYSMTKPVSNGLALASLIMLLSACATQDQSRVVDAAVAPLNDLNLIHAEIPASLQAAQQQPYAIPPDVTCDALVAEVHELDTVLGPDLDAPATESNPSLIERGVEHAQNAAIGALRRTTEGAVPFRGWVRKLSGAERYSKRVAAAIAAGTVRRAFIKGLMASKTCS
jgi:hypothetical protein